MVKPNTYQIGGVIELDLTVYDTDNNAFIPTEARISVKEPTGTIVTYSGGISLSGELTVASGYLYALYRPPVPGWFETESWCKDSNSRETANSNGFEVVDRFSI